MGSRITWGLAVALVAGACTASSADPTSTTTPPVTSTSSSGDAITESSGPVPGRLAVVDDSGGIVVMGPDGSDRLTVTERGGDNPSLFTQPVWSPDGASLAWGQRTGTGFGVGITEVGSTLVTTLTTPNLPFYTFWSPDGRHLGLLHNGTSGVQLQIADTEGETTTLIGEDAPLYFSWSPDGSRVVTHAGAETVESVGVDGARESLEPSSPGYLAPQWTDRGVFHVADERLVLEDGEGDREVLADVAGLTMFVSNPQGTRVALQSTGDGTGPVTASLTAVAEPPAGAVVIVDTTSFEVDVASDAPAVGFFWSPDGERLLVLTASDGRIEPLVWEVGETEAFPGYIPHPELLQTTFPFFPQYAQSVSFWAPDSSAFAYAGARGERAGIWVQEIDAAEPDLVSDGSWVAWSPTP